MTMSVRRSKILVRRASLLPKLKRSLIGPVTSGRAELKALYLLVDLRYGVTLPGPDTPKHSWRLTHSAAERLF